MEGNKAKIYTYWSGSVPPKYIQKTIENNINKNPDKDFVFCYDYESNQDNYKKIQRKFGKESVEAKAYNENWTKFLKRLKDDFKCTIQIIREKDKFNPEEDFLDPICIQAIDFIRNLPLEAAKHTNKDIYETDLNDEEAEARKNAWCKDLVQFSVLRKGLVVWLDANVLCNKSINMDCKYGYRQSFGFNAMIAKLVVTNDTNEIHSTMYKWMIESLEMLLKIHSTCEDLNTEENNEISKLIAISADTLHLECFRILTCQVTIKKSSTSRILDLMKNLYISSDEAIIPTPSKGLLKKNDLSLDKNKMQSSALSKQRFEDFINKFKNKTIEELKEKFHIFYNFDKSNEMINGVKNDSNSVAKKSECEYYILKLFHRDFVTNPSINKCFEKCIVENSELVLKSIGMKVIFKELYKGTNTRKTTFEELNPSTNVQSSTLNQPLEASLENLSV